MSDDAPGKFVTVPQAARRLGIGESTLQRAIRLGDLPAYKLAAKWPLVRLGDLEVWIASRRVQPREARS